MAVVMAVALVALVVQSACGKLADSKQDNLMNTGLAAP